MSLVKSEPKAKSLPFSITNILNDKNNNSEDMNKKLPKTSGTNSNKGFKKKKRQIKKKEIEEDRSYCSQEDTSSDENNNNNNLNDLNSDEKLVVDDEDSNRRQDTTEENDENDETFGADNPTYHDDERLDDTNDNDGRNIFFLPHTIIYSLLVLNIL